tara:strand:- start:97838 stop:97996 length:159 start_codon:yes stop_codon:yes gene_type:complete
MTEKVPARKNRKSSFRNFIVKISWFWNDANVGDSREEVRKSWLDAASFGIRD